MLMTEHEEEDEVTWSKMVIEIEYTDDGNYYRCFGLKFEGETMEQRNVVWLINCMLYNLMCEWDHEEDE